MVKKLQDIGAKISEKQKLHADLAIESARASILSQSMNQKEGVDAQAEADQYMTNGAVIEEEKNNVNKL